MKRRKNISYEGLQKINDITRVETICCLPVFREGIPVKQADKLIGESFIEIGKTNWDWYFLTPIKHKHCEEIKGVYFSKFPLRKSLYDFLDYLPELKLYMFTRKAKYA